MQRRLIFWVLIITFLLNDETLAQSTYPLNSNQDVIHYKFNISVNDTTNVIVGKATLQFILKEQRYLALDLTSLNDRGLGMIVNKITNNGESLKYIHKNNRLRIDLNEKINSNTAYEITIDYEGIPANGLIIDNNMFGERTFFGDNYPDRARNWLPSVDHPADKAKVTWIITAPDHYKIVASGKLVSELKTGDHFTTTTWDEQVPISTKVMTFGAANFAVKQSGALREIPITTWVYQQNDQEGFYDFAIAPSVLAFYDSLIGPYPYEKLANVQSKTTYGGMENAGNIFYFEKSVNGKGERETLIAHEIVHQWFGNSATEKDWPHAWLSEGFATYLTSVYVGARYGLKQMDERLTADRKRVIDYWHKRPGAIVNHDLVTYPKVENLHELLNTNTYQKASWVLHMLRNELGDDVFWQSIHNYYSVYKDSIASTADFQRIVEDASGKDLQKFFKQWLYGEGQPVISGEWHYDKGILTVSISQSQEKILSFLLELGLVYNDKIEIMKLDVISHKESLRITVPEPNRIITDPNIKLLFEGESVLKRNQ